MQVYFCVFYHLLTTQLNALCALKRLQMFPLGLVFHISKCATLKISNGLSTPDFFSHYEQEHSTHHLTERGMLTWDTGLMFCLFVSFGGLRSGFIQSNWVCAGLCVGVSVCATWECVCLREHHFYDKFSSEKTVTSWFPVKSACQTSEPK